MKFKRNLLCHGNVVANPTFREGDKNGRHYRVSDFTVAVNTAKDAPPIYINCTAWDRVAQQAKADLSKGTFVEIEGEFGKPNTYLDKRGDPQASYRVKVLSFKIGMPTTEEETH